VPRRQKFELIFAPETVEHMKAIESQHHSLIRMTIEEQLKMAPHTPTRNRKRLETPAPFDATWELRFGSDNRFRVLYEIDEAKRTVNILAIGIKDRSRLLIGGEEFK
jgi:mRNA-degrading endonuclease RelE of RelBE toxin-antitoxin system